MNTATPTADALPAPWARIVAAIVRGPRAWATPAELASALGIDEDATLDELASMDVAGLIDIWEHPDGVAVTLSTLTAGRLGYRLVEPGALDAPRWAAPGEPDPPPPRASNVVRSERTANFDFLVDPRPGPDDEAARAELAARLGGEPARGPTVRVAPPRPTQLIGTSLSPWPGPDASPGDNCPACGNRALPPHAYCLYCDRWGLDAVASAAPPPARPARSPRPARSTDPDRIAHQADLDRRRRKDRLKDRLSRLADRPRRLRCGPNRRPD